MIISAEQWSKSFGGFRTRLVYLGNFFLNLHLTSKFPHRKVMDAYSMHEFSQLASSHNQTLHAAASLAHENVIPERFIMYRARLVIQTRHDVLK